MVFPELSDITWGGFIKSNIRKAIVEDCLSSGDPHNMFRALEDAIENIRDEIIETDADEYWEKEMLNWKDE